MTMSFPKWLNALVLCVGFLAGDAVAQVKAEGKWVEQEKVEFSEERQADGDSFGMTVEGAKSRLKRTYRLYGVDCPETDADDPFLKQRIQEQAKHFGCDPQEIPRLGKEAAAFTEKLLKRGKPRVFTRGKLGEKVEKAPGRPQRYYAMVEVTAADGKRRMLHELLLEAGLARAFGTPAAWPPGDEDRHGKTDAEERFAEDLERLERKARTAKVGAWNKPRK